MARQGFNGRGLVSLLVAGGFLIMTVTGLVLYITPQGRVAYWIDWTLAGLGKDAWADVHISSSLLFILAGVIHLTKNWRPFLHYLRQRVGGHRRPRAEGWVTLAALVALTWGTLAHVPPISYLLDLNVAAKGMWSLDANAEPPFGHAEEVSVKALAFRTHMDLDQAMDALRGAGLAVADGERTSLRRIADDNGLTPAGVYAVMRAGAPVRRPAAPLTAEAVQTLYAGTGMGAKTLAQAAEATGVAVGLVQRRLDAQGIAAAPDERVKAIAEAHGLTAMDLVTIMLLPEAASAEPPAQ